ncbi:hypothetical protein Tco_1125226 [Tanacetum coccineum]|uniref:Integrase catalytic domain-containing protein n=1 Tax=Tanacetum coccineum TaxID=301880 RepID=A0ABQ5J9K5_9ASTR
MADSAWIEAMQDELHQFDRLQVWELVDKPFGKNVIKLKCCLAWSTVRIFVAYAARQGFPNLPDGRERQFLNDHKGGGLQIHQSPRGIFINQAKYTLEILKKHGMEKGQSIGTPMATKPKLDADLSGEPVDQTDYRSKIGSLMYLTSSRPDIVQAVCYCARYQARPTEKHLKELFSDADHAGCLDTRKSTSGGIQFLGDKLVSWMSKKQDCTAMSSAEAEYVALSASCAQVMWMRTQLQDYGFTYNKIPLYCDSQSAIAISCNPVQHSKHTPRTKHIILVSFHQKNRNCKSCELSIVDYLLNTPSLADPLPPAPAASADNQALADWNALFDRHNEVACLMLGTMSPKLYQQFENKSPQEMITELQKMYGKPPGVELQELVNMFHSCKQAEGQSVSDHVLLMKSYLDQLATLNYAFPDKVSISFILNSLSSEFQAFVQNYNMQSMEKTISEVHSLLIEFEKSIKRNKQQIVGASSTPHVMAIQSGRVQKNKLQGIYRGGKIQKANKKSLNAKGQNKVKGKGKDKKVYIPKPKNPKPTAMERPTKDDACHHCKEGFRIERKLKQGALYLYMGNGVRAQVEAIGSFDLVLPNGIVICLDNCHYAPTITRGVVSVSRLVDNGFVQCFMNYRISVSKNDVLYFNAIDHNGIYEIDMHDLVPNVNSIYSVSNKRVKRNLDSTYLWHCCLAHINKKRIKQVQQDGLLKSTDDESFDKCESCLSGKMAKKPFPHSNERAKDLLGIIHTDICGLLRHVSRQGAIYFITFTDDYSRYGYVYLLKHKHEVFETFKVFKNEVENQLGKTIKAVRSDRGGEYISQEFKDYLKANGIIQQLTPLYTPQHNGVSERRNRTLLDMVRSMMNLPTLPLSFWDYALESTTCILNMVPTKKVDKTPYELWYGKVLNLSYLKVWGCASRMWNWPSAWLVNALTLQSIRVPTLYDREDFVCWRDTNGSLFSFSVKYAWEALRPCGHEVTLYSTVWFSQCIPRHAF